MLRHLLGYPVKWQANRPPSDEVVILFMVAFGIGMVVASARILKLVFFHNKRPA